MEKLLKPILKALLKACAPVLGSLTVDLAEAGVSHWIDAREKAAAEDVSGRLLKRLRESVQPLTSTGGLSEHQLAVAFSHVEAIIGNTRQFVSSWKAADFDPDRAAADAMNANRALLAGLSMGEAGLVQSLLQAMFSALSAEAKTLEQTEAAFRKSVLSRIDRLGVELERLADAPREALEAAVTAAALSLRVLAWRPDLLPPGALLRADIDDPVSFHGRMAELEAALAWARDARPLAVRLYTGAGGIGKTRLLREVATNLRSQGWQTGFLDDSATSDHLAFWQAVVRGPEPRLYVIDYAENRREHVIRLVRELMSTSNLPPRRLVLLARAADEWWSQLKRQSDGVGELLSGPATERLRLGPVADTLSDRRISYDIAAKHFARKLGRRMPEDVPDNLADEAFERALLLHMAALAAVEGVKVKGDQGILDDVLRRERKFWSNHVLARGLPQHLERGVGRVMAAVTLQGGAASAAEALQLVSGTPIFADQPMAVRETIAHMLHELYPGDRWIEPILPDLLGEHLVQEELGEDPDALLSLVLDRQPT